jgi:hypothetical protein
LHLNCHPFTPTEEDNVDDETDKIEAAGKSGTPIVEAASGTTAQTEEGTGDNATNHLEKRRRFLGHSH